VNDDFTARFPVDLGIKDLSLGCQMAETLGNDAKTMKTALDYFKSASEQGLGHEDCCAIYKISG
jgi:3-hydroxyisobutyrate dehydrogenase-like beta-hydroxyacid dehydrogenase